MDWRKDLRVREYKQAKKCQVGSGRETRHREPDRRSESDDRKGQCCFGRQVPLDLVMILIIKNKDFFKKNFTIVQKTPDDSNLKAPCWKTKAGASHSLFTKVWILMEVIDYESWKGLESISAVISKV